MLDFPVNVNGIEIRSVDVYNLCRSRSAQSMQRAIEYIVDKTGCERQEAKEVVTDILHMDNAIKNPPKVEFSGLIPNQEDTGGEEQKYIPKCPVCGSPNLKRISGTRRLFSLGVFGLASSSSLAQRMCKNCGYKF